MVKRSLISTFVLLAGLTAMLLGAPGLDRDRRVYVSTDLESDQELARVEGVARTASEHGINGMLLSAGFDSLDLKSADYLERLARLKRTCDHVGVEIIPAVFRIGFGDGVLAHDKNLAAGLPVRGARFVAGEHEARFEADPAVELRNGGFEQQEGNLPAGFTEHGARAAIDTRVFHSGKASVRFEDFSGPEGAVYLAQAVRVHPYRCYRLRAWVKTENAGPRMAIHLRAAAPEHWHLSYMEPVLPESSDWHVVSWGFNSWYADEVEFQVGVSDGNRGKVWVDDVGIEEVGLTNVLRRPGTPVKVRDEKTDRLYEEGRDFAPISDPQLNFRWNHEGPAIQILPGSRIHPGDSLRVDYFHGVTIYDEQVTIDMSEPAVYEVWQHQVPLIEKYLAPKKYLISMDEVRVGGFCEACQRRHLSTAQILTECVARQRSMIRAANPQAEIYIWSDIFDPDRHARDRYYLVNGGFAGTWNYLPKDLVIACDECKQRSLDFFSKLGFRILSDITRPEG